MELGNITKNANMMTLDKSALRLSQIEQSARDFEALFVTEMMKPMFDGLETDGMFGGGKTEEVFRDLLLDEYGKQMAGTGQLNIADSIKAEMIAMQAAADGEELAQNMHGSHQSDKGE